jgi:hypothetical protein
MHRPGHVKSSRRKTKKATKKGGYYSFSGALGTGAPAWSRANENLPFEDRGGNAQMGGRKKRKGGMKTRKVKRGGLRFGQSNAGFTGVGTARGLGGYQDVSTPGLGKAAGGEFADHGAKPGDFSSFK